MDKKFFGIPVLVLALLVCFMLLCNPFVLVGPGERGIKFSQKAMEKDLILYSHLFKNLEQWISGLKKIH